MKDINSNERLNKEIDKSFKKLALICVVLLILPIPLMIFISENHLGIFVVCWFIWAIISVLLAPKITMKIWKN